ncbi:MAG: SIMPL domain-containing protein [Erythrobacter sp.]
MKTHALALTAAAFAVPAAAASQVSIQPSGPVVELSVYEAVTVAPDIATIGAGVTTEAPTATEALAKNSAAMQAVVERIKALGIAAKDIQTTGINLNAQYDYDQQGRRPAFRGYQAANRVSVTLRKVADTGKVLDALVDAGANDLNGPTFAIADDTAATAEARTRALARATAQAKAYASALGYSGTKVLAISEAIAAPPMPYEALKAGAPPPVSPTSAPVEPGMVAAGVNVTVTFELTGGPGAS